MLDFFSGNVIALCVAAFLLCLLIGSFLNVVIYRLPLSLINGWRDECKTFLQDDAGKFAGGSACDDTFNIAFPASHCPTCKAPIKAWHNIPLISYIFLKGRCHACKTSISTRYPLVELTTAVLSVWCVYHLGFTVQAGLALVFTWCLITLTMIDIDHQLLPDNITLPLLWLGLLVNTQGVFTDLNSAVIGAAIGYMILWSIYWIFKLLTKKEGMGFGDFKLLAALGAWMGWQALPVIIILSSLVGAVIGIAGILILGKEKNKPIPFGPYLAIAGWSAFFWGEQITQAYLAYSIG